MEKMDKDKVGMASEFAVASELARWNIYAQPTFGHLKRTDLLILDNSGRMLRIEVKGKQSTQWPNCKGISDSKSILVLVDFANKSELDRPDFYILTFKDWCSFVDSVVKRFPDKGIEIDSDYCPVWPNQVDKNGKPYKGCGVTVKDVIGFKDEWGKIKQLLQSGI